MASTLSRAFTKRVNKSNEDSAFKSSLSRGFSIRKPSVPAPTGISRSQISLPIELLQATNPQAFEAPDIHSLPPLQTSSDASSTHSLTDSLNTPALSSSSSIASTDFSREQTPVSTEPTRFKTYFDDDFKTKPTVLETTIEDVPGLCSDSETPKIPQRALSHTKKTHQVLARKRSVTRLSGGSQKQPMQSRTSADMFSSKFDASHPFGAELAQVNELAEEFAAKEVSVWDEEEQYLHDHGLQRFAASDYLVEIQDLYGKTFGHNQTELHGAWL